MKNTMNLNGMFQNLKNNPMFNMLKLAKNHQQQAINILEQNVGNNPFIKNILELAKSGNNNQIETIARNMLSEVGLDPDETYEEINSFLGMMK